MKHLFKIMGMALATLLLSMQTFAQMQMPPVPVDPNVRIGHLENGLTYYIRHNERPERRVEFYIAQKVGSILEEPQQRGLAHFLEHMAFNGTKNFPGDEQAPSIVQWCESKGIKFGTDLNAYTSVDETVYNINNVPTTNQSVIDSCLLILHDWSNYILLEDQEIDKERGVIREEWRTRNSGMLRVYTDAQATMYPDSKYADCMPIGSIDVINNFPYQDLRDYYKKWYHPDLQGIIIVGDIDVDDMEARVKKIFADIPKAINPAERIYYPVADNKEPIVYIGSDKEVQRPIINIFFKQDVTPDSLKNSVQYLITQYMLSMASTMLNERFEEITQKADAPFLSAESEYGEYFLSKVKEAYTVSIQSKVEDIGGGLTAVLTELERVRRYGFTESEYERARANYLQQLESLYKEREKTNNRSYVREYIRHFLESEPTPGIEYEYNLINQIAPRIPIDAINMMVEKGLMPDSNQVVMVALPEKAVEKCPSKETILSLLKGMSSLDVKPYEDKVSNEPLISEPVAGGQIIKEEPGQIYGTTKLTLSNGVKVYIKKTDYQADKIIMKGTSRGGSSLFANGDALNIDQLNKVSALGGLGKFSVVELNKQLAGKHAMVNVSITELTENIAGNCAPKDFETLMQLIYLSFTAPRKDMEAFDSYKTRLKAQLEGAKAEPLSTLNDTIRKEFYGNHPRLVYMKPEMVDQIDYDRILEMYKDRFADASDFTFYFVGNIDLEETKPLIAQYLGGLPATNRKENFKDNKMVILKGIRTKEYAKEQQTPTATTVMAYSGKVKENLKDELLMTLLSRTLSMVFTEEIRENEGGAYSVSCYGIMNKYPTEQGLLQIVYQTDPTKVNQLNDMIIKLVEQTAQQGPTEDHLIKAKEYMLKKYASDRGENSFWLGALDEYFFSGMDITDNYKELLDSLTVNDVKKFANALLKQKNRVIVVLTIPEETKQ